MRCTNLLDCTALAFAVHKSQKCIAAYELKHREVSQEINSTASPIYKFIVQLQPLHITQFLFVFFFVEICSCFQETMCLIFTSLALVLRLSSAILFVCSFSIFGLLSAALNLHVHANGRTIVIIKI